MSKSVQPPLLALPQEQYQRQPQLIPNPINPQPSPLTIPEILLWIGSFLNTKSLAICLRVSKTWYNILVPLVWNTVHLKEIYRDFVPCSLLPLVLDAMKHATLVRKLIITLPQKSDFKFLHASQLKLPNLSEIVLYSRRGPILNERSLTALIRKHQSTLLALTLNATVSNKCFKAVAGCTHLKSLKTDDFQSLDDWSSLYDPLWSRLQLLSWKFVDPHYYKYEDHGSEANTDIIAGLSSMLSRTTSTVTTIQYLTLDASPSCCCWPVIQRHLFLIFSSPELIRLKWICNWEPLEKRGMIALLVAALRMMTTETASSIGATTTACTTSLSPSPPFSSSLSSPFAKPFGRQLEHLDLFNATFSNVDFKELMQTCSALTRLVLYHSSFDASSWAILKQAIPHCVTTFKELLLAGSENLSGSAIHDILCTLSGLESFSGNYVTDIDFSADRRPWVCRKLQRLTLAFMISEREKGQSRVFERLSNLTELTDLRLSLLPSLELCVLWPRYTSTENFRAPGFIDGDYKSCQCLEMSLDAGMGALNSLSRLTRITGPHCARIMWGEAEFQWCLEHWTRLRFVQAIRVSYKVPPTLKRKIPGCW
ncbi:hypothetical protein BGZ83_009256 [Gryganskiella cystojenkinii]|nr:hypothetical protein BGZ83_009256 [Gryganskiella cystojenkinii]